jgi:hypothetical protein
MTEQASNAKRNFHPNAKITNSAESDLQQTCGGPRLQSRRNFLGKVRGVAMGAAALSAIGVEPLLGSVASAADSNRNSSASNRSEEAAGIRISAANAERRISSVPHITNGDEERYSDKCGTYTKALLQDGPGRVNLNAYQSFRAALNSGNPADFENILMGGDRKLTNPQSGLSFDVEGTDSAKFGSAPSVANQETVMVVPAAPALASAAYGAELIELYWASLLRDVPFTQYASNPIAAQAAQEISALPEYAGPRRAGQVTPDLLFRGIFPGETAGPYMSQFFVTPTFMGQQPISNQHVTFQPAIDYLTDLDSWALVQNGGNTGLENQEDPQLRFKRNGRDLAAFTHMDMLFQEYFVAFLVLSSLGVPMNPGNPYHSSRTQTGFATFAEPHCGGMVGEVAWRTLERSWYQKWFVHRRHRPESGGGIVHLTKTGQGNTIQGRVNSNVLNSQALQSSFNKFGSYLLAQAFPEGSPTHPSYPTGHGAAAGACITILKFFDGLSLVPYSGPDQLTVNGELNKLAHNVTFGHGIHAGIHWRSDSDVSMVLGEATAISMLQDQAQTYNEKFTVNFTKLDGTTATISNQ